MTALGLFAESIAGWRKLMAAMPDDERRWQMFSDAAFEFARYVRKGLPRNDAVDQLQGIATAYGLLDADHVTQTIADAFRGVELESTVLDEEPPPHTKTNGHAQQEHAQQEQAAPPIPVYRPFPIDEATIPPRDWIIPGFLMRRQVTVLVAPSGAGKSLLTLQVGISCGLKIEWAGWRPREKFRVLMINTEDDIDEMRRRLAAAAAVMKFNQMELHDRFLIADVDEVVVAKIDNRTKTMVRTPLLERVVAAIIENKIDLVFVDPFAETFEGDENSNSELKWAGVLWREVARRTNAAVCIVHHTKKYASGMAGDVDAARGAGALIGIARIVATIFPMTQKEAEVMGVKEDRSAYLRYDDAKANLNLTSSIARWFKKDTITLHNATTAQPADQVGTLVPWKPKGMMDGILEDQIIKFFEQVDRGCVDSKGETTGEYYTFDSRKGSEHEMPRYVGDLISRHFNVDETVATQMMNVWRKNGRLIDGGKYRSPRNRKERSRCLSELSKPQATEAKQEAEMLF